MNAQAAFPATVYARANIDTQREAARIASGRATEQATRVLYALRTSGDGLTRAQLADVLGMKIQTVCPRVYALIEAGLAYERGTRDGGKVVRAVSE